MNLNSREGLIARLRRGRKAREQFVDSHLGKGIAHQIRATRERLNWSQGQLAQEVGMNQNGISRLESPGYGRPTITTLRRLAAALDVGLVVHFVPFSQMIDWVSGTRRVDPGLTTGSLAVPSFSAEEEAGVFDTKPQQWADVYLDAPMHYDLHALSFNGIYQVFPAVTKFPPSNATSSTQTPDLLTLGTQYGR